MSPSRPERDEEVEVVVEVIPQTLNPPSPNCKHYYPDPNLNQSPKPVNILFSYKFKI